MLTGQGASKSQGNTETHKIKKKNNTCISEGTLTYEDRTAVLPYLITDSSVKSMKVNQLNSGAPSELSIVFSSKVQVLSHLENCTPSSV